MWHFVIDTNQSSIVPSRHLQIISDFENCHKSIFHGSHIKYLWLNKWYNAKQYQIDIQFAVVIRDFIFGFYLNLLFIVFIFW